MSEAVWRLDVSIPPSAVQGDLRFARNRCNLTNQGERDIYDRLGQLAEAVAGATAIPAVEATKPVVHTVGHLFTPMPNQPLLCAICVGPHREAEAAKPVVLLPKEGHAFVKASNAFPDSDSCAIDKEPYQTEDVVNHPSHYTSYRGLEVIQLTEQMNFNRGNAVKYVARAGLKNNESEIQDLQKAAWYIQREIERLKGE